MKANKPSATAHLIACSMVALSRHRDFAPLVPPMAAEASAWFVETCPRRAKLLRRCAGKGWFQKLVAVIERLTIPGMALHYLLRKQYLERVVRDCLNAGTAQLVVLGAGFDTLALRLQREFAETFFFELDHPATQHVKQQALEIHQVRLPRVTFLPVDFTRDSLAQNLLNCRDYNPTAPTLFVAEGVLMYLPVEKVRDIFQFIRAHAGSGSRFAFTFLEPRADGEITFKRSTKGVDLWLKLRGEPFRWGIERDNLAGFLRANGFALHELANHETLRARYLTTETLFRVPLAEGECICVAERQ